MNLPLPDPSALPVTAPTAAELRYLAVRRDAAQLQAVVRWAQQDHRLLLCFDGLTPRWDCSCGAEACPAAAVALAAARSTPRADLPSHRQAGGDTDARAEAAPHGAGTGTSGTARIFYRLVVRGDAIDVTLHVGIAPEPDLPELAFARARESPAPRFVTAEDRTLAEAINGGTDAAAAPDDAGQPGAAVPIDDPALLEALLATGRAYLGQLRGTALTRGSDRPLPLAWRREPDGAQALELLPAAGETVLLPATPYVHAATGEVARVALGPVAEHWAQLRQPCPLEDLPARWDRLSGAARSAVTAPWRPRRIVTAALAPQPRLRLRHEAGRNEALFAFGYGTTEVPAAALVDPVVEGDEALARCSPRDWAAEAAALGRLRRTRWQGGPSRWRLPGGLTALARFLLEEGPTLEADGWELPREASHPVIELRGEESLSLEVGDGPARLIHEGRGPNLLSPRGRPVRWAGQLLLEVDGGRVIGVPEWVFRDVRLALGTGDAGDQAPPRSRLLGLPVAVRDATGRDRYPPLEPAGPPRLPTTLRAELRPYQHQGLAWLQRLADARIGGLLADDMGLGKTIQTLALLAWIHERETTASPALVVAPLSLLSNWKAEARRFTPTLPVHLYHGPERSAARLGEAALVLTTYGLVRADQAVLADRSWRAVILDEAQAIKNPDSRTARAVRTLEAPLRLCLSGTPMENHLGELWSLFAFLEPGLLGNRRRFDQEFRSAIEAGNGERRAALLRRLQPFVLRRTRAQVLTELPPLVETEHRIELGDEQRSLYETLRASAVRDLDALEEGDAFQRRAQVLAIITRLRQACCAPALLPARFPLRDAPSAKLEALDEMLAELLAEGRSVLVFSQFTGLLELVRQRLEGVGTRALVLTGATRDRGAVVARFQAGEAPVFLISLKAGGAGLNLTRADTVILLDPWWNPAVEQQATARAHRLGQTRTVFVYRLIAADTIEDDMQQLKAGKSAMNDALTRAIERFDLAATDLLDPATEAR